MLCSYNKKKNFQFLMKVYFLEENLIIKKISPPNTSAAISNMGRMGKDCLGVGCFLAGVVDGDTDLLGRGIIWNALSVLDI